MLEIKSLSFDELIKVKTKVEAEIELRDAKERARLIDAIATLGAV